MAPPSLARTGLRLSLILVLASACASAPVGPPFTPATDPPAHRGRIYLYRADQRSSPSVVRLKLDGQEIGTFRDGEYETLEVAAGSHLLGALMRNVAFVAWGWNELRFRVRPGQTVYLEMSVRLTVRDAPIGREFEVTGRSEGVSSENVVLQERQASEALSLLDSATRLAD